MPNVNRQHSLVGDARKSERFTSKWFTNRGVPVALSSTSNVSQPTTRCLLVQRRDNRPRLITRFNDEAADIADCDVVLLLVTGVNKLTNTQQAVD